MDKPIIPSMSSSSSSTPYHHPLLRRSWPPDLSKMSPSDRYRLERKYKRRVRIRGQHPANWMRFTGTLQLLTITVLPAYMVLIMDWPMEHPFGPVREWMWKKLDGFRGGIFGGNLERGKATEEKSVPGSR
ncbi:hypothetical protein TWF106_002187 [Orbilia oligospora]|uniref:Transmembrane protein n=1 Tax=Orbilia oligospora TaxID=2813651 RepID=A0A6G1M719_ORBOL|nr:hypothetical protein TWF679_010932 [Orbilia oligospora]KAF3224511.1 hypothetical protein TWF191_005979 [Orbilia oligospora]KAF3225671.1 hypothetical protein TWF106_002187 [Orbilia oligospora]KAF3248272.1 hypothetical protein TWF192_006269 [Orbilia oligospora]